MTPRYSRDDTSEEVGRRKKREISSEQDYYSFPIREDQEEEISSDQVTGNGPPEEISQSSGQLTNGLSSALLTSALDGHKVNTTVFTTHFIKVQPSTQIRHIDEKIDLLSEDDSIVKAIVSR